MKRYKVKDILRMLKEDDWYLDRQKGSHRQFKHETKKNTVTVAGKPSKVLPQRNLISIFKQAGWR